MNFILLHGTRANLGPGMEIERSVSQNGEDDFFFFGEACACAKWGNRDL